MTASNFAVTFPNIPDAGTRHFATYREAADFVARCGFHAVIRSGDCVVGRNSTMGGSVAVVPMSECSVCASEGGQA